MAVYVYETVYLAEKDSLPIVPSWTKLFILLSHYINNYCTLVAIF